MNAETFTERKTKLEEFYKQRIKFNIYRIDIIQANPRINIYDYTTNIFFKTHITFTEDKFLMSEFYTHLKPIIFYAYSYTYWRKHIKDDFFLKEDNSIINYNYEHDNKDIFIKNFTKEETKIINPSKIIKSEECIICLENQPIILFCNCGHIPICTECYKLKSLSACPICKTENEIIRTLE